MERAVDEFGFFLDSKDASPASCAKPKSTENEWLLYLQTGNWNHSRLKKMCRLGIPDSLRAQVWIKLADATSKKKEGLYNLYLQKAASDLDHVTRDVIHRDLSRTFPNHVMFNDAEGSGVSNLNNVLSAYAVYNPLVGYCQGMGMVVGIMLMRMPAEDAFYLLIAIVDRYMTDYYTPDLSQLRQDGLVFDHLLHKHSKRVAKKLGQLGIDPLVYLTQWFMPIYALSLPWRAVLRVWDIFFCDGVKALHRIALGIIHLSQDYILARNNSSDVDVLKLLLHIPKNLVSPDELVEASLIFRITKLDIEQIRAKMRLLERNTQSQSNAKLINRPKFGFDIDVRGHFLFSGKGKDTKKVKSDLSDFSVTAESLMEVVKTDFSNSLQPHSSNHHSDWGSNNQIIATLKPSQLAKSMSVESSLKAQEVENNGPPASKLLENYISFPSHNSLDSNHIIIEQSET